MTYHTGWRLWVTHRLLRVRYKVRDWWIRRFITRGYAVVSLDANYVADYFLHEKDAENYMSDSYFIDHVIDPNRKSNYRVMLAPVPRLIARKKYDSSTK